MLESCSSLIACCNCGVMTSDWVCRRSRRCESAMLPEGWLETEPFAEVDAPHILVGHDLRRLSLHQYHTIVQNVCPIDDLKRFSYIVIGYEYPNTAIAQVRDQFADVIHGDRINAGQRLVQQNEVRL